jgi:elongation factor Ts
VVGAYISADGKSGALVEVNCETDFVAKNDDFIKFANDLAELTASKKIPDAQRLSEATFSNDEAVEEVRKALIMKLGENISVRRCVNHVTEGRLASYLHGSKIGVMIDYNGGDETIGKDLAMHIAASKPVCVNKDQVSAEVIEHERQIFTAQAAESGKPANIIEKMVEGRVAKFLAEVTLLGQPFVKDPDLTVEKLLAQKSASVSGFTMYVVGEGIEKKVDNFADEVRAQMEQTQ